MPKEYHCSFAMSIGKGDGFQRVVVSSNRFARGSIASAGAFPCRCRVGLPYLWAFSAMKTPLQPSGIPSNREML
jgi:hypothetical protein